MTKEEAMKERGLAPMEKSNDEFDFEKDLSIDPFNLDKECLSHAVIYFRYADAMREAKTKVTNADDQLKLVYAERNIGIREELSASGKKFTESVVTAELEKDPAVISAKKKLRYVQDIFGKLTVAVQAMEARKSQLDNLVKLHCSSYFANKQVETDSDDESSDRVSGAYYRKSLND